MLALILAVITSIYTGIATATEAAVLGVLGSLALSWWQDSLNWETFQQSVFRGGADLGDDCLHSGRFRHFCRWRWVFTGIPRGLAELIGGLNLTPLMLIAMLTVFYIILGCFLDGISSIVLTMAVIEPMVRAAGFDMIWFGVYLMIVVEMAQITPPIGFNLFVLQGMTGHDMGFISRASVPMFLIMCLAIVGLVMFPDIATFLPANL